MFVKKFEAPSLEQALRLVKLEMGPEALILSTHERKGSGLFSKKIIEVTAASEKKQEKKVPEEKARFDEAALLKVFPHRRAQFDGSESSGGSVRKTKVERYIDLAPPPKGEPDIQKNDPLRFERNFSKLGLSAETARELSKRLSYDYPKSDLANPSFFEKAKSKALSSGVRCLNAAEFFSKTSWVPLGVAGSGKTTVLVKLALLAKAQEKSIALVSLDSRKVLGRSELAGYARLIKVPFFADLSQNIGKKFSLIDSPAYSTGADGNRGLEQLTVERSSFIVLDASSRLNELLRQVEKMMCFSPEGIVFTRMDTVAERGILYDVLKLTQLPLIGFSESQSFKTPFRFLSANDLGSFLSRG